MSPALDEKLWRVPDCTEECRAHAWYVEHRLGDLWHLTSVYAITSAYDPLMLSRSAHLVLEQKAVEQ